MGGVAAAEKLADTRREHRAATRIQAWWKGKPPAQGPAIPPRQPLADAEPPDDTEQGTVRGRSSGRHGTGPTIRFLSGRALWA